MDDRELWSAIQAGNEHALKDLFYRYYSEMVHWANRFVQDEALAKDMGQDVFVKIWDRRKQLQIRGGMKPYLLRATRNNCLNYLKKKKNLNIDDYSDTADNHSSIQETLQAQDLEKQIEWAIGKMPEGCRMVFLLRRKEELSVKEIAQQLQISPKTVENQLTKARKILVKNLAPFLTLLLLLLQDYFQVK